MILMKLEKAKELFRTTNKNVAEVAFEVGFNDALHFSKIFKKYVGKPPRDFKEGL
jgi:transcriptional regulator GlxA family with amidase domain